MLYNSNISANVTPSFPTAVRRGTGTGTTVPTGCGLAGMNG